MLHDKLEQDLREALKAGDSLRVSTIRFLLASVKNRSIDKKADRLDDAEVISIIKKMAKQRDDSIEQFRKGNRDDLADKEQKELEILSAYLPKQLTAEEITPVIEKIIQETGAGSKADMGRVMKAVISELGGRADGKIISRIVGALLK